MQDDSFSHVYTLVVKPYNSYIVKIDNKKVESGSLEDDWDFLPPKKIKVSFVPDNSLGLFEVVDERKPLKISLKFIGGKSML